MFCCFKGSLSNCRGSDTLEATFDDQRLGELAILSRMHIPRIWLSADHHVGQDAGVIVGYAGKVVNWAGLS